MLLLRGGGFMKFLEWFLYGLCFGSGLIISNLIMKKLFGIGIC